MYQCYHFRAFSIHWGSAWIILGSARALPGTTGARPGSTWAIPASSERQGKHWHESGAHPGWLVGNYRSAAVTATILSPRIVPDHPGNLPKWSWAMS
jgi:hypothetical protein